MNINTEVMFSSKTDNWETPQGFFDELDREFNFTLDPCADDFNRKCQKYYTKEENGLIKEWSGERVFCNPPYGKALGAWVQKCFQEVDSGKCPLAVMLIPARTDTKWFHNYIYKKAELRFVKGRLRFGGSHDNAPFPSMIVIFKKE